MGKLVAGEAVSRKGVYGSTSEMASIRLKGESRARLRARLTWTASMIEADSEEGVKERENET